MIDKKTYKKDGITFIGFGGGGFSLIDHDFENFADKIISEMDKEIKKENKKDKNEKIVLVTHAPPYGTKLDFVDSYNGNQSIRDFIEKVQPKFAICGHFHENRGEFDYIGKTEVINPGPHGRIIEI